MTVCHCVNSCVVVLHYVILLCTTLSLCVAMLCTVVVCHCVSVCVAALCVGVLGLATVIVCVAELHTVVLWCTSHLSTVQCPRD